MIRIDSDKKEKNIKRLLDIIHNDPTYHLGSFHEECDISTVIDCLYNLLYQEDNKEVHIIVEKNTNNSLSLTVDKVQ